MCSTVHTCPVSLNIMWYFKGLLEIEVTLQLISRFSYLRSADFFLGQILFLALPHECIFVENFNARLFLTRNPAVICAVCSHLSFTEALNQMGG